MLRQYMSLSRQINPELKSVVVLHNYSKGADKWLYSESLIDKLRLWWNAKVLHDEADVARLMDSSSADDSVNYLESELFRSRRAEK